MIWNFFWQLSRPLNISQQIYRQYDNLKIIVWGFEDRNKFEKCRIICHSVKFIFKVFGHFSWSFVWVIFLNYFFLWLSKFNFLGHLLGRLFGSFYNPQRDIVRKTNLTSNYMRPKKVDSNKFGVQGRVPNITHQQTKDPGQLQFGFFRRSQTFWVLYFFSAEFMEKKFFKKERTKKKKTQIVVLDPRAR